MMGEEGYEAVGGARGEGEEEGWLVRLRRWCVKECTSVLALALLALSAAAALRNAVSWHQSASSCAGLGCGRCGAASHCAWCEGPALPNNSSMPGYCEDNVQTGAGSCSATLGEAACAKEEAEEARWGGCRAHSAGASACEGAAGCIWCEGTAACVPAAAAGLCAGAGTASAAEAPAGLTSASPACATTGAWVDRSNDGEARLARLPLNFSGGYREGLVCTWVLECPFNETVEVRFSRVSLEQWDSLRIVDGWDATVASETVDWSSQVLAYYTSVSGERIMPPSSPDDDSKLKRLIGGVGQVGTNALNHVLTPTVDISVSVSGGRSARQAQSLGPVLAIQLQSGTSAARKLYSQQHGGVTFPAGARAAGFEAAHRCTTADAECRDFTSCVFSSPLLLWWILAIGGLRLAHKHIFRGAQSDGLWSVNPEQLQAFTVAMNRTEDSGADPGYPQAHPEPTETGALVAAITQSEQLPNSQGRTAASLALSSMEKLPTDDDDHSWVDVSWWSPLFLLDVISCCACCWEGFSDLLFATLQFRRPNGDGVVTGSLSLAITAFSTFMFLSPRGQGISAGLGVHHFKSYQDAKLWVYRHARLREGHGKEPRRLRDKADWQRWLKTPQGRHRPHDLSSHPDKDYHHHGMRRPQLHLGGWASRCKRIWCCCCCCCCRCCRSEGPTVWRDKWEGWSEFFQAPVLLPEHNTTKYHSDLKQLQGTGWVLTELRPYEEAATRRATDGGADAIESPHKGQPQAGREPGWLCGEPPTNKWDSDVEQLLYGRPPDWLMILLTVLQLRVPVEGLIAWRNVRMLKRRSRDPRSLVGQAAMEVRSIDWQRARVDLDKALLREGIFEILPQTVLEFQNLWTDRMTVLDLMSVPGFPFLTWVSEYHQCYGIMLSTIITASLDLTTPYSAKSAVVGMTLYVSVVLHLTARLFVFGSVLSLQHRGERDVMSTGVMVAFFVCTYIVTLQLHKLCSTYGLYHEIDFRRRTDKAKTQYEVTVTTGLANGASLVDCAEEDGVEVWVGLRGEKHGKETRTPLQNVWTDISSFDSAGKASQTIECDAHIGKVTQVELQIKRKQDRLLHANELDPSLPVNDFELASGKQPAARWQVSEVEVSYHELVGVLDAAAAGGCCYGCTAPSCLERLRACCSSCFSGTRQEVLQVKRTKQVAEDWVSEDGEPLVLDCEEEDGSADGMEQLNMTHVTATERQMLFAFINCFTCTDKNITVAPTSLGSLLLGALRILEAAVICWLFSPGVAPSEPPATGADADEGAGVRTEPLAELNSGLRVKPFLQAELFLAVFLQIGSFCCLLAAAAGEKHDERIHDKTVSDSTNTRDGDVTARGKDQPRGDNDLESTESGGCGRRCGCCCSCRLMTTLLSCLLMLALATLGFALSILLRVYLVTDETGTAETSNLGTGTSGATHGHGSQSMVFSCRTAVLLSLFSTSAVVLVCIQMAASTQLFWGDPKLHHSSCEQVILVVALCGFVGVACLLNLGSTQTTEYVGELTRGLANETIDLLDSSVANGLLDKLVMAITSKC